jgi:hypothetical protein
MSVDDARIQELIGKLALNPKDEAAEREFWKLFCHLPTWNLLSTADAARKTLEENRGEVEVQMFQDGDRSFLPVFTSDARVREAVEGDNYAILGMPPEAALAYMCGFRGRIDGFIVNPVPGKAGGFGHRLPDLCAFFYHEREFLPAGAIHVAVDHVRNTSHPKAYEMVHGLLAGVEKLYVAFKDDGFAFVRTGDELWFWAFSDAAMAVRACQAHEGLRLIEATPAEFAKKVGEAMASSEGRIKGAVLNHPEHPVGLNHELLERMIAGRAG